MQAFTYVNQRTQMTSYRHRRGEIAKDACSYFKVYPHLKERCKLSSGVDCERIRKAVPVRVILLLGYSRIFRF